MRLEMSADDLRPIVAVVVQEVLAAGAPVAPERIGYPEREAAGLLGVAPHTLRDCRRRGEISARLVGKQYVYAADELRRWLRST
jgi:hypothetical protein